MSYFSDILSGRGKKLVNERELRELLKTLRGMEMEMGVAVDIDGSTLRADGTIDAFTNGKNQCFLGLKEIAKMTERLSDIMGVGAKAKGEREGRGQGIVLAASEGVGPRVRQHDCNPNKNNQKKRGVRGLIMTSITTILP